MLKQIEENNTRKVKDDVKLGVILVDLLTVSVYTFFFSQIIFF